MATAASSRKRSNDDGGNGFSRNRTKIKGEGCNFISVLPARKYLSSQKWRRYSGAVTWKGRASNQPAYPRDSDLAGPLILLIGQHVWSDWTGLFQARACYYFNVPWYSKVSPFYCTLSSWTDFPRRTLLVSSCLCLDHSWLHRRVYITIKMLKYLKREAKYEQWREQGANL